MFGWFCKSRRAHAPGGRKSLAESQATRPRMRGSYDAAQTPTDDRYWIAADGLSADAANSKPVRQKLRNRSRYEIANGGYASGMVQSLAVDQISTGPRLQMLHTDPAVNDQLEKEWIRWAQAVGLASKLRTMVKARVGDGEAFGILTHNPMLPTLSKLNMRLVEAEHFTTPFTQVGTNPNQVDGIDFDDDGNPVRYWMHPQHPGGLVSASNEPKSIPAEFVIHWFHSDRPGQHRGIPDFTPSLRLFQNHRRYLRAVIAAAETAASISAVIQTDLPVDSDTSVEAMDVFDLEPRSTTVLPEGYKLAQLRAEQPTLTFSQFIESIVTEEARPLLMPRNIATGDSSSYNYASGRLDHQTYDRANDVERDDIQRVILERVFDMWLRETLAVQSGIAPSDIDLTEYEHEWFWNRRGHVDPQKESKAQETKLANLTTTLADEYAQMGKDWQKQLRQRAKELALIEKLGMTPAPLAENADETEEEEADDETAQTTRE